VAIGSVPQIKDLKLIIKNKDIFEKAQQRETSVDWYSKLQESKEKLMDAQQGKLPFLLGEDFSDAKGAFDRMI